MKRRHNTPGPTISAEWAPRVETRRGHPVLEVDSILQSPDVALAVAGACQFDADMALFKEFNDNKLLLSVMQNYMVVSGTTLPNSSFQRLYLSDPGIFLS